VLAVVETAVNGDSKSTNPSGLSLVDWACRASTIEFCSALAALVGPVTNNIFFLTVHYFNSFALTSWAGSRDGPPVS
jgi:hypothetical protein